MQLVDMFFDEIEDAKKRRVPFCIPIGTIVRVRRASAGSMDVSAVIRPFVDFDHLSYVLVERHGG